MNNNIPSVSQVVQAVKNVLEGQFRSIEVVGEVSNLSSSGAGHYYFTLSDAQSSLSCSLFRMDAMRNPFVRSMKNGDKIVAQGPLGVYAKRGTFQLVAKRIAPAGKGDLKEQLELLKKRLAGEGLFDLEHKQSLPQYPKRVGLITAHGSAAYHDFVNVLERRSLWMDIVLYPAMVQGDKAPASLRKALSQLIKFHLNAPEDKKLDVIVLTRGGGSLEDLWCFNDEALAWDIYNCPIPIISAVGHEVDYSISDFVADKRCETPTAAAEILSEAQTKLKMRMKQTQKNLADFGEALTWKMDKRLAAMSPERLLRKLETKLYLLQGRVERCKIDHRLLEFTGYHDYIMRLEEASHRLQAYPRKIESHKNRLEKQYSVLRVLDPKNVLGRGYTYLEDESGKVITNMKKFNKVEAGQSLKIHFQDGKGKLVKAD